jgi:hypothetical protein
MATGQGTITFNFGSGIGTNVVTATVSDATISATSKVEIYLMGTDSTATHNAYEHSLLPMLAPMGLSCISVTAGVGFTAQIATQLRLTGTIQARYVWAD